MKDYESACRIGVHVTPLVDRFEAVERVVTRRDNPYRTILADRDVDPPIGRMLSQHLALGAGVGFLSAGLASIWLCLVGATSIYNNGAALVVIIVPVAAVCGAIAGATSAVVLGLVLWPTLALRLARFVYPAVAGLIQGWIMWAWALEAFDPVKAAVVGIGSILIAVYITSRWTAHALVQLSRLSSDHGPTSSPAAPSLQ